MRQFAADAGELVGQDEGLISLDRMTGLGNFDDLSVWASCTELVDIRAVDHRACSHSSEQGDRHVELAHRFPQVSHIWRLDWLVCGVTVAGPPPHPRPVAELDRIVQNPSSKAADRPSRVERDGAIQQFVETLESGRSVDEIGYVRGFGRVDTRGDVDQDEVTHEFWSVAGKAERRETPERHADEHDRRCCDLLDGDCHITGHRSRVETGTRAVRVPMAREIDGEEVGVKGQCGGIPRVRVLCSTVDKNETWSIVAPAERGDLPICVECRVQALDLGRGEEREAPLLGVLMEEAELVILDVLHESNPRPVVAAREGDVTERLSAIVLAAGQGSRMLSTLPKPLHRICGRPMVLHVIDALAALDVDRVVVVVGHEADLVVKSVTELAPDGLDIVFALQAEQRGTGDAVNVALGAFEDMAELDDDDVLVLPGDTPLLTSSSLAALVALHDEREAGTTLLTAAVDEPTGYGRVLRARDGRVASVVEHADATEEQRAISEVNTSIYCFRRSLLAPALRRLAPTNAQGELYLTDVVGVLFDAGYTTQALCLADSVEAAGVNDRAQLASAEAVMRDRINRRWLDRGVTMWDPAQTYVDASVDLGCDVVLLPGSILRGTCRVGEGAHVGPNALLEDTVVGERAHVGMVTAQRAEIGADAVVASFSTLRPGAVVASGARIEPGTVVEH